MSAPAFVDGIEPLADGNFRLHYTDEASVRRALARLARACGWRVVLEEVAIPGWGSIDLLLRAGLYSPPVLLELKLDLTRPAAARKAFQQIDGYSRGWTAEYDEQSVPMLAACKQDMATIDRIALAYPQVTYKPISAVIGFLTQAPERVAERLDVAVQRAAVMRQELALHDAAVSSVRRFVPAEPIDRTAAAIKTFADAGLVEPKVFGEVDF